MRLNFSLSLVLIAPLLLAQERDHRMPTTENVINQPIFSSRDMPLDDQTALVAIDTSQDENLKMAVGRKYPAHRLMPLVFHKRIALQDGDYFLCIFDPPGRVEPGNSPRVLVLFNTDYSIKTWGEFICEPGFGYGTIVHPFYSKDTDSYLITVNPQFRNGGMLWFEKYRITPNRIEKLGEGPDPTKIPNP